MKNKYIIISSFSPRDTEIASLRIGKMAKFLSINNEVTVVAGVPFKERDNFFIDNYKLIEINYKSYKKNVKNSKSLNDKNIYNNKINKFNVYHFLEYFFSISPGGMRHYNFKKFFNIVKKEIEESKNKKIILISSYGPFFITKLGFKLKKMYPNILWINDFRDVFRNFDIKNDYVFMHNKMKTYLFKSDFVSTVSDNMTNNIISNYNIKKDKTFTFYNGYDEKDFNKIEKNELSNDYFKIVFTGSFYPNDYREIDPFLKALKELNFYRKIKFIYCGKDSEYVKNKFFEYNLNDILIDKGVLSREEAINMQNNANLLLLVTYTGNVPSEGAWRISGKAYEYLYSDSIILNIGSKDWELLRVLESDNVSKVFEAKDYKKIALFLEKLLNKDYELKIEKRHELLSYYNYRNIINRFEIFINDRKGEL
jgi:glycosyltransferase involved in cell wall biosynthesis